MYLILEDNFRTWIYNIFPEIKRNEINFLSNMTLYLLIFYIYYVGNADLYMLCIKYFAIITVFKFFINNFQKITKIKKSGEKTKYSQINSSLAIFVLLILILHKKNFLNTFNSIGIILAYTILSSLKYNFTNDNIFTILFVYFIFSLVIF